MKNRRKWQDKILSFTVNLKRISLPFFCLPKGSQNAIEELNSNIVKEHGSGKNSPFNLKLYGVGRQCQGQFLYQSAAGMNCFTYHKTEQNSALLI